MNLTSNDDATFYHNSELPGIWPVFTGSEKSPRVLIIGSRADSRYTARRVRLTNSALTPTVLGYVDVGHTRPKGPLARTRQLVIAPGCEPVPVLGMLDDLPRLIQANRPTHVVITRNEGSMTRIRRQIAMLQNAGINVIWMSDLVNRQTAEIQPLDPLASALLFRTKPRVERLLKRVLDITAALAGILILSPLLAMISVGVLISSGRPILYSQTRVGQNGRLFQIFKFRSMRRDAESHTGPIWASSTDTRCTRLGTLLRRTNLDELPQLFNVVKGDMSLVGPRPERPVFIDEFRRILPDYDLRHAMPVGMTGWAQVHGWRGRTSIRKRLQYDLDYIQRWSFWLDIKILWMTVEHVVLGRITWITRPQSWWERRQRWP